MEFKCFNKVTVKPYKGVCLYQILIEMKFLSSATGLPVVAEIKGEKVEITAITNISNVYNSLKTKKK
jgi:hypothetical protein